MRYQILFLPKDIEAYNSKSYKVLAQHLKVFSQLLFQLTEASCEGESFFGQPDFGRGFNPSSPYFL